MAMLEQSDSKCPFLLVMGNRPLYTAIRSKLLLFEPLSRNDRAASVAKAPDDRCSTIDCLRIIAVRVIIDEK